MDLKPNITDFSHELLCHILEYLPLREILSVAMLSRKMLAAVNMHLQLCKSIDFCQDSIFGYMPSTITDDHLLTLLKKCPHLEIVYGLHPVKIERRRLRKRAALTIPGIIEALSLCFHLKAIETSDLRLFEAIMQHLPQLEIIGHFQNRNGLFPPQASQRLKLQPYPRISSLHLIGVEVPELTAMPHLQHLHLQCVRFTKLQPFRAFLAQNLKSFVMKHCIGPSVPQRYLSLIIALSSSPNLSHLELVRVPLLNGLFQRAVEDSYRHNGFVNLRTLVISGCKGILEADLGHLMIVASKNLETLYIQPSLTKDSLFVSLSFAQCSFPVLRNLHLGYIDNLNSSGEWSNDTLLSFGLAEVPDTPSSLTDSGMKVIGQLFPHIKTLSVSNCPHLMVMYQWMAEEDLEAWFRLTDLTLQKCHCLQLSSFVLFVSFLPNIQVVILNDMFREPPKGCSHVGLSAGTGLGMSSAVVSNQDEHIAVQGHHQEFEPPGDEENEEIDREFIDGENEDNPEPQFMVLQRDFFDGEDNDGAVGNPPLENEQDPAAEDQGLNNTGNEVNNSLPGENNVVSNESIVEDNRNFPSSASDKHVSSEEFNCENQSCNISESKYCLRNSGKKLKSSNSDCTQKNILPQENCYSIDFKKKNNVKKEACNNDYYNTKNNSKLPTVPEILHKYDYDPHKPSTSKAGSHLDYSDWDDQYKCSKGTKRSNKCSDSQNLTKKQKSLKITEDVTVDEKVEEDCKIFKQINSSENSINNHNDCENDYSSYVKDKLPENTLSAQRNLNEIPASNNTNKIPENFSCYVLKKGEIGKEITSHMENKNDDKIIKVNNLSRNVSSFDCFHDDQHKNTLNISHNIVNRNTCRHIKPSKDISNESEKQHPFIKNEDESSYVNSNSFNDYKKEINEAQINENAYNTSSSKSGCAIPINCSQVTNFDLTDELPEKKLHNDVYELQEHEILLDDSFNERSEETVCKTEVDFIPEFEKTALNADKLPVDENSSASGIEDNFFKNEIETTIQADSVTAYSNSVATQTCVNGHDDRGNISLNENKASLIHAPMNKSNSLDSSKIIKPCFVLVTKVENIHSHFIKYSGDGSGNNKNSNEIPHDHNLEQPAVDYFPALYKDENSFVEETSSKNLEIYDCSQPSTSRAEIDICNNSSRHSRSYKKMHSSKYFKKRKSPTSTRNKEANFSTAKASSENEISYCSVTKTQNTKNVTGSNSQTQNMKNVTGSNSQTQNMKHITGSNSHIDLLECNTELPFHDTKQLRKFPEVDKSDEDTKFYVSIPNNGPFKIINSVTGKSYQTPQCHVVVAQLSNERCDNFQKRSKYKEKPKKSLKSPKTFSNQCDINLKFSPDLPSTSKGTTHSNSISKDVTCLNDKSKVRKRKQNHIKCINCRKLREFCCNCSVPLSVNAERLSIKNSDAMLLLKQRTIENNREYNSHKQISSQLDTNDTNIYENKCNLCEQKFKNEPNVMPISENPSYRNKIEDNITENDESSSSEKKTNNSPSCIQRKRRKRKVITYLKRIRKPFSDSKDKINYLSRGSKNNTKRTLSVPMISLISQGTQATSADIRRSVRRIRRAAARRRTVPPVYTSKGRYSSKISAKILTKRPVCSNPRPESFDKATSTSDPLLEDDAVQTLQLSSSTLLSFSVVSCGISDLIIDRCPKLVHIEVQACRILKRFQFNNCPAIKRLNVSQCPKLNICALAAPVMSLTTDSYFIVSYEPCMQGYHPGEGEKAILSKASINQSVLIFHDFCDISNDSIQAKFRERTLDWLRFLSQFYTYLNHTREKIKKKCKSEVYQFSEYPWSHDLRRINGHYSYSSSSDFCDTEGRYQLLTNNPIFCDIFETHELDSGFPDVRDCAAFKDPKLISHEVIEKYIEMQKKFVAFYIPVTENNQANF